VILNIRTSIMPDLRLEAFGAEAITNKRYGSAIQPALHAAWATGGYPMGLATLATVPTGAERLKNAFTSNRIGLTLWPNEHIARDRAEGT
jgi:hypothetical protein